MKRIIPFLTLLFALLYCTANAQTGQYTIRLVEHDVDCDLMKYYVDIEIKASTSESHFFIVNQNYRFSFDENQLANPQIEMELVLSGQVTTTTPPSSSSFDPHDLNGSAGSMVSYNVIGGGTGYPISHDTFVKVGRLSFDLLDADADIEINLHTEVSGLQPTTFIAEDIGIFVAATEGPCYDLFSSKLNVHVFLEGPLDTSTGRMSTKLNEYGLLPGQTPNQPSAIATPDGQPFSGSPWNYTTSMSITDYAPTVVDWVIVSLRDDYNPTYRFRSLGLVHDDGHVELLEPLDWGSITTDSVYVSVQTRGHMTVISHQKVKANCRSVNYDFRFQDSYIINVGYGQSEISPGVFGMYGGDINHTGAAIDGSDFSLFDPLFSSFNRYESADFNLDGEINFKDKFQLTDNNGITNWIFD